MTTTTATITRLSQSLREPQLRQGREGCTQASGSTKQAHACPSLEDVALGRPTLPLPQNSWKPWWVSTAQGPGEGGRWHGPPISFAWTSPYKSGSPPRAVERPNVASGAPWPPPLLPSSAPQKPVLIKGQHTVLNAKWTVRWERLELRPTEFEGPNYTSSLWPHLLPCETLLYLRGLGDLCAFSKIKENYVSLAQSEVHRRYACLEAEVLLKEAA